MRSTLLVAALLSMVAVPAHAERKKREKVATRDKLAPPSLVAPATLEPPPRPPGLTLPQGAVQATTTFEMSVAANTSGAPASIAPDISAGFTDELTLAIVSSGSAMTGFRGGAGAGFCFTGPDKGKCRTSYAGGGVEGLYSLSRGGAALAANAGVLMTTIDPTHVDVKLGFKTKLTHGRGSFTFNPSIWYALNARNDQVLPHEDQLFLPVGLWAKLTPEFSLGLGSGVRGPLRRFGSRYAIPIGVAAQLALNPQVSFGSSLVFGRVIGGSELMDPEPGLDGRAVQMWLSVSSR